MPFIVYNHYLLYRSTFIKLILNVSEATFKRAQKNLKDGLTYMDKATAHVLPQGARGKLSCFMIMCYEKISLTLKKIDIKTFGQRLMLKQKIFYQLYILFILVRVVVLCRVLQPFITFKSYLA